MAERYKHFTLIFAIWILSNAPALAEGQSADLRVMSFNIRFGTAPDGENHWDRRRAFLVETIKAFNPDLLGTQETLGFQRDYLAGQLSDYDYLGVGRDDGKKKGEMMALYYKKSRFEKLAGGHFWLSVVPDKTGSKSWDSSLPRMVTWVRLRDRQDGRMPSLVFFNTHFDHRGVKARIESAWLLRRQAYTLGEGNAVVVTGDFNSGEGSDPYQALFGTTTNQSSPLIDTFRAVHPKRQPNEGTFTAFRASVTDGPRIDWIGCCRGWKVLHAEIIRTERDGRTPSDHYPVAAVLRWSGPSSKADK